MFGASLDLLTTTVLWFPLKLKHQPLILHPDVGDPNLCQVRMDPGLLELIPNSPVSQDPLKTRTYRICLIPPPLQRPVYCKFHLQEEIFGETFALYLV